mmetsp:Transcript_72398/g.205186  ORF Transcript_72398/g.205186 Transcript_72398/m.205186 type:complete len:238 (-) Transcript_72398:389-1102(-)
MRAAARRPGSGGLHPIGRSEAQFAGHRSVGEWRRAARHNAGRPGHDRSADMVCRVRGPGRREDRCAGRAEPARLHPRQSGAVLLAQRRDRVRQRGERLGEPNVPQGPRPGGGGEEDEFDDGAGRDRARIGDIVTGAAAPERDRVPRHFLERGGGASPLLVGAGGGARRGHAQPGPACGGADRAEGQTALRRDDAGARAPPRLGHCSPGHQGGKHPLGERGDGRQGRDRGLRPCDVAL